MATLWKGVVPPEYTRTLTGMTLNRGKVIYGKYLVNKLGVLSTSAAGRAKVPVREFLLPPVPTPYFSSSFNPMRMMPYERDVLITSMGSGALCRWQPGRKSATYLYAQGQKIVFIGSQLGKDSSGRVWAPCNVFEGWSIPGVAARVEPGMALLDFSGRNVRCTYWQLPSDFMEIKGVWVDGKDRCWFSIRGLSSSSGYAFGMLDPNSHSVTAYGIGTLQGNDHPDIKGVPDCSAIWLTAPAWGSRVYKYREGRNAIEIFSHNALSSPEEIALDSANQPWFTCDGGEIATITDTATEKEAVKRKRFKLKPKQVEIIHSRVKITPVSATEMQAAKAVKPQQLAPPFEYWDSRLGSSSRPYCPIFKGKELWFSDPTAKQIGLFLA